MQAIVAGFAGQLKGWWDFSLTQEGKNQIINAVKREEYVDANQQRQIRETPEAVNTLLYTIGLHFIGSTTMHLDRSHEQLMNLRCPDLSHFKWYKDVFLIAVLAREDSQYDFWKEKFISGLPSLFAERVRNKLKERNNGIIPYHTYTYGELASEIVTEGLALCNEIKIHRQMKKDKLTGKRMLGDFCEQFGYEPLWKSSKKKEKYRRPFRKTRKEKYYEKKKESSTKGLKKHQKTGQKAKRKDKSQIACYRCGCIGHYANKCRLKQQIQALTIDEELKNSLAKVFINDTDSEKENEINVVDYTEESDQEVLSNKHSDCDGQCDYYKSLCAMNGLYVLTKKDTLILDLIDQLPDDQKRQQL
ncbi:uncharacterized protein LOC105637285 [Jatropha curcas]|uniref:uncharacterized protein LOC105637285 n=1 Tax=Jatropha curcas TaxID=180498 RepID=UPI001894AF5D|nr:uncharacterized protein LOC105637285 [Jatropha curcas]